MRFKKIIAGAMAFTIASVALPQTDWFAHGLSAAEYEAEGTDEAQIPSVSDEEFAYGDFICKERLNKYQNENTGEYTYSVGIEIIKYTGSGGSVEIPETVDGKSVTDIDGRIFFDCVNVTSVTVPKDVERIVFYFSYHTEHYSLSEINVDENNRFYSSLDGILYNKDQTELKFCPQGYEGVITVSEHVKSITTGRRCYCKTAGYDVNENNPYFLSEDGVLYNKNKTVLWFCPRGYEGDFVIPDSVTSIAWGAFFNCSSLTSVTFPKNIDSVADTAFAYCTALKRIIILDKFPVVSLANIMDDTTWANVFIGDENFSEIYVDENSSEYSSIDGVLYNKDQTVILAFPWAYDKDVLTISDKVVEIKGKLNGIEEFRRFSKVTAYEVDENNTVFSSADGVLYNKDQTELISYPPCKKGPFVIPDSVEGYIYRAFACCQYLESIVIPNGVTTLNDTFQKSSITSVTIPDSVTIMWGAFSESRLSSIVIPASVTIIDSYAFYKCPYYPDGAPEGAPQFLTIYGESGSYAETYANENNIRFEAIKTLSPGEDGGVDVEVVTKPGDVPDGAEVSVTEKDKTDVSVTFDITITVNGEEIKLSGSVYVKIPVPVGWNGSDCKVYRKEENGKYTDMKAKATGNFLSFVTDHFSEYVITTEDLSEEGGDTGTDTEPEVTASPDFSGGFSVPEASVETAPAETSEAGTIQSEILSVSESEEVSFDVSEPVSETEGEQETTAAVSEENSALSENTSDSGSVISDEDKNINTSAYPAAGIVLIMAAAAAAVFITKKHK